METNYKYSFVPLPNDTRIFHFRAPASRPLSCMLFMCLYFQWNHAIHAVLQNAASKLCSINIEYKRNICNTYIKLKIRTKWTPSTALPHPQKQKVTSWDRLLPPVHPRHLGSHWPECLSFFSFTFSVWSHMYAFLYTIQFDFALWIRWHIFIWDMGSFFFNVYLLVYFWLCWVFAAAQALP